MALAIETDNLCKWFGEVKAVENLKLRVSEGEIYAFLGLNGAGKTTTIRMLLGMIRSSSGFARVFQTIVRPGMCEPWGSVGYLVEIPHAYPELTLQENLEVARRLHPGTPKAAVIQIIERLALAEYANRRAGTLSQGNAQRLGIAKALLHDPKLVILDEPALGLDPAGIVEIRQMLLNLAHERGVTVFMSSHILAEVARLADRIGIIHKGRLLQEMDADELEQKRMRQLLIRVREVEPAVQVLNQSGFPAMVLPDGTIALRQLSAIMHPDEINRKLVEAGHPPTQLLIDEEELERYFLRLVGTTEEAGNA
jgi:ABC-2 type transport system ATP-binding protein